MTPAETPVTTNARDVDQVKAAQSLVEEQTREQLEDTRDELGTFVGRRRLWRRISECGVFTDIAGDVETVYRALGRRAVGLQLLRDAMAHPELFLQMQNEAIRAEKRRRADALSARTRRATDPMPEET